MKWTGSKRWKTVEKRKYTVRQNDETIQSVGWIGSGRGLYNNHAEKMSFKKKKEFHSKYSFNIKKYKIKLLFVSCYLILIKEKILNDCL